jgi:hypothetical protein
MTQRTNTPEETPQSPPLVSLNEFISSHHPPLNMRWLLQMREPELRTSGAVVRLGRRILVCPEKFWSWLTRQDPLAHPPQGGKHPPTSLNQDSLEKRNA